MFWFKRFQLTFQNIQQLLAYHWWQVKPETNQHSSIQIRSCFPFNGTSESSIGSFEKSINYNIIFLSINLCAHQLYDIVSLYALMPFFTIHLPKIKLRKSINLSKFQTVDKLCTSPVKLINYNLSPYGNDLI